MSFQELDMVVLVRDLPDHLLRSGDTGAIVHLHSPDAFEVEFMRASGTTVAVIELTAADVRLARDDDQMAVRSHAEMTGRE